MIAATNARTHASTITERGDPSTTAGRAHASTTVTAAGVPLAGTTPTAAPFVTAPIAPLARFSASAETVRVGQTVNLQSIANEGVTSWRWDLGDGRTTTGAEVKVSWSDARTVTITLTVSGPGGDSAVTHVVTIEPRLPAVHIQQRTRAVRGVDTTWSVTSSGATGGTWSLSGSPTITLGDAGWLPGDHFHGTFNTVGATYVLTLTVHNSIGETTTSSVTFTVVAS